MRSAEDLAQHEEVELEVVPVTGSDDDRRSAAHTPCVHRNARIVRIQWGDCDPAGIIFNARYFEIFDASTTALFESLLGITKREIMETYGSAGFPLVRMAAQFVKPPRFGDDVTVESTISFGHSSFQVEHRVTLRGDLCAEGSEVRVWVVRDCDGIKSNPIPKAVPDKFGRSRR